MGQGVLLTGQPVILYQEALENSHLCPKKSHCLHTKKVSFCFFT